MTTEELSAWISDVDPNEIEVLISTNYGTDDPGSVFVIQGTEGNPNYLMVFYHYEEDDHLGTVTQKYIAFTPQSFEYEGATIPSGWSDLTVTTDSENQTTYTAVSITEKTEKQLTRNVQIEEVSEKMQAINGNAIGVIKA